MVGEVDWLKGSAIGGSCSVVATELSVAILLIVRLRVLALKPRSSSAVISMGMREDGVAAAFRAGLVMVMEGGESVII